MSRWDRVSTNSRGGANIGWPSDVGRDDSGVIVGVGCYLGRLISGSRVNVERGARQHPTSDRFVHPFAAIVQL